MPQRKAGLRYKIVPSFMICQAIMPVGTQQLRLEATGPSQRAASPDSAPNAAHALQELFPS